MSYKVNKNYISLKYFYDDYINKTRKSYNKDIMKRCLSYNYGEKGIISDDIYNKILKDITNVEFHTENVLIVSKVIRKCGGVQKTSMQLMEILDYNYNIKILSVVINENEEFDIKNDYLHENIPINFILKIKTPEKIIHHINNSNYKYIIVNKLHEIFTFLNKLNKNLQVICHNPKDSYNELIIKHQNKIDNCFVLTNYHKKILKLKGFKKKNKFIS